MNLSIKGKHFELTDSLKEYVQEKSDSLERFEDKITELRASLEVDDGHHRHGRIYGCVLVAHISGIKNELVAKGWREDMHTAINEAFNELERSIKKEKEKTFGVDRETARKIKEDGEKDVENLF